MEKHCIRKCSKLTRYADNFRVRNDGFYENGQMCSSDFAFMKSHVLHRLQPGRPEAFYSCQLFKVIWWLIPLLENPPPPHPTPHKMVRFDAVALSFSHSNSAGCQWGDSAASNPLVRILLDAAATTFEIHSWALLPSSSHFLSVSQMFFCLIQRPPASRSTSIICAHVSSFLLLANLRYGFFLVILQWSPASWTHCWL